MKTHLPKWEYFDIMFCYWLYFFFPSLPSSSPSLFSFAFDLSSACLHTKWSEDYLGLSVKMLIHNLIFKVANVCFATCTSAALQPYHNMRHWKETQREKINNIATHWLVILTVTGARFSAGLLPCLRMRDGTSWAKGQAWKHSHFPPFRQKLSVY